MAIINGTAVGEILDGTNFDDFMQGFGGNDHLQGYAGNDIIYGGDGNDSIDGDGGADIMQGGTGDDSYYVENIEDVVTEAPGEGDDSVTSYISYILPANVEDLFLQGNAINGTGNGLDNSLYGNIGNNTLIGGAGNDTLFGGSGADTMKGGTGDDRYYVYDVGDVVTEALGEGDDQVSSRLINYVLPANVEDLFLESDAINGTGNGLDNSLYGNIGNNTLIGGAGNDTLFGGSGADTMKGGTGDDTYIVENVNDVVTETLGQGIDFVASSISYVLGANVERLILSSGTDAINGTGNSLDNLLIGNANNNTLKGGAGNDFIDGGVGTDTMQGGAGDDGYTVDNVSDVVTETLGQGIDFVVSSISYVLGANVEYLVLTGTDAINGTGNGLDNYLLGNTGNNTLKGGAGNDTIIGGTGLDKLNGGTGADRFIFNAISDSAVGANRDVITDFSHAQLDLINVSAIDSDDSVSGDQAFTFIGNAAFSAAGQLRYDALKGIIQGNVNSTLTPDFEIKLTGAPVVDATDFVL